MLNDTDRLPQILSSMSHETPRTIGSTSPDPSAPQPVDNAKLRKKLERSLQLQSQLLELLEHAAIATTLDGTVVYWNRCASDLYGWQASEAIGKNIMEITVAEGLETSADAIMSALREGQSWQGEFVVHRRDGSRFTAMVADYPIFSDEGELVGMIGLSREISQLEKPAREADAEDLTLERVNAIAMKLLAEPDVEHLLQVVIDAATELTRSEFGSFYHIAREPQGDRRIVHAHAGLLRHRIADLPTPGDIDQLEPMFRNPVRIDDVRKDPRYTVNSQLIGMPTGQPEMLSYLAVPVISRTGELLGGLFLGHTKEGAFSERMERTAMALAGQSAIAIDNSRLFQTAQQEFRMRKRTETEVRLANEVVDQASDAKNQFLAMLSHELRTPLTPVLAAVYVLETDERMPEEFRPFIDIIHRNIELEARLIDDLIDFTRISRGTLQLNMESVDLHRLVKHVVEIVEHDLEEKRIGLALRLDANRHQLHGDAGRLQQVLWNLLKNAIKFTAPGGTITITTANDADGWITLRVSDTGIGIPEDRLPYIFNAFEQGERAVSRTSGGLGLGLAISRKIVEMHSGRLTAFSAGSGLGSTFIMELPEV